MRSSTSARPGAVLALGLAAALAASLGLKVALAADAGRQAQTIPARSEGLRRFLAASAGPVTPVPSGWSIRSGGCRLLAFPSGVRGTMDLAALAHVHPGDRVAYVYRGQVLAERPTAAVAFDTIAYLARRPFHGGEEPAYVVLVLRNCPTIPALPWSRFGA